MKINVEVLVHADLDAAWAAWTTPNDILQWNAASDDWHTTSSKVDLRVGGRMSSRMEAKDGSTGFDFDARFTLVDPPRRLVYALDDGREVSVTFTETPEGVHMVETFDSEDAHDAETQRAGWQAILDNFAKHCEAKAAI